MAGMKLGKLPDRAPVKITLSLSPELGRDLGDYAEMYEGRYGESVPVPDLAAAMLEAFLASDREFAKRKRARAPRAGSRRGS